MTGEVPRRAARPRVRDRRPRGGPAGGGGALARRAARGPALGQRRPAGQEPGRGPVAVRRRAGVEPPHRPARAALGQHRRAASRRRSPRCGRPRRHRPAPRAGARRPAPPAAGRAGRQRPRPARLHADLRTAPLGAGRAEAARRRPVARLRRLPRGARRPQPPTADPGSAHGTEAAEGTPLVPSPPRAGALPWGGRTHGTQPVRTRPATGGDDLSGCLPLCPSSSASCRSPPRPPGPRRTSGHDISWPQCPRRGRRVRAADAADDDPLRRRRADQGPALHARTRVWPDQVAWAKSHGRPAQAYTMAAFPTTAQLRRLPRRRGRGRPAPGPGSCPTSATPRRRTRWRASKRAGFAPPRGLGRRRTAAGPALADRAPPRGSARTATSSRD